MDISASTTDNKIAQKLSVIVYEGYIIVSVNGMLSEHECIKLKKEILDVLASKSTDVGLIFDLTDRKKLTPSLKETMLSLASMKQINKVACTGNFSALRLPTQLFGGKTKLKFYKTTEESLVWISK